MSYGNNKDFNSGINVSGLDFNQTSGYPLLTLNTIINDPSIYSASVNLGRASIERFIYCSPKPGFGCTCVEIKNSSPSSDGYLGLGLVKGTDTYYGWVHLSVSVSYNSVGFTVKNYAYNSVPGQPILAGQTSDVVIQAQKNGTVNVAEQKNITTGFLIALNSYPNPFSNSTTISFTISQPQKVS